MVTGECNLKCKYCYAKKFRRNTPLEEERRELIIKESKELGIKHIAITGGEPLVKEWVFRLVEIGKEMGIKVSITTNGTVIDEKKAKKLKELDTFLYVSIDGRKEEHSITRGNFAWLSLLSGIKLLQKLGIKFATITTLNKVNYKKISKILPFLQSIGSEYSCFLPLMKVNNERNSWILTKGELFSCMKEVNEITLKYKHQVNLWCMPFFIKYFKNKFIRVGGCRKEEIVDIGVDGSVLLCDTLNFKLSSVKMKSLYEAIKESYHHPLMKKITSPTPSSGCKGCEIFSLCLGGCYSRAFFSTGKLNEKDPLCPLIR